MSEIVLFFIAGVFYRTRLESIYVLQGIFYAGCLGGITLLMVLRIPVARNQGLLEESLRKQSYEGSFLATCAQSYTLLWNGLILCMS